MVNYSAKTKLFKCLLKDNTEVIIRNEHLDFFEDKILSKEYIGNLVEIKPIIYDNMFYTD